MKGIDILKSIVRMSEDDNKGLKMTLKVLNACTINDISQVTFQTDKDVISSAGLQSVEISGDYMCCAFFINRNELNRPHA